MDHFEINFDYTHIKYLIGYLTRNKIIKIVCTLVS